MADYGNPSAIRTVLPENDQTFATELRTLGVDSHLRYFRFRGSVSASSKDTVSHDREPQRRDGWLQLDVTGVSRD